MNSLKTQDGDFIRWYLGMLINNKRILGSRRDNTMVYLPYTGGDEDLIFRLFKGYVRLTFPEFVIDKLNTKVIEYLIQIAVGKVKSKGLIVRGACGVGKTAMLKIWLKFRHDILSLSDETLVKAILNGETEKLLKIDFIDPMTTLSRFTTDGYSFFTEDFGEILFIDDLGPNSSLNYFGTNLNILEQLIYARYSRSKENRALELYATTNLTTSQLSDLLGERALSRLIEMTAWKEGLLEGTDRRKESSQLKVWPKLPYTNQSNGKSYPNYDPI